MKGVGRGHIAELLPCEGAIPWAATMAYTRSVMPTPDCRACAFPLPASGVCRDCGEDHRGWYARLARHDGPATLQAQAAEIREMQASLRRQRNALSEEEVRLRQHRAATAAGQEVITETKTRLAHALVALNQAGADLEAAALDVEAVRFRMLLETVRADLDRGGPAAAVPTIPAESTIVNPDTGVRVWRAGPRVRAWSPLRAFRPAWSVAAPKGPLRFGGAGALLRVLVGADSLAVLAAEDGRLCWSAPGTVLDCWEETVLLATAAGVELRSLADGSVIRQLARTEAARFGWILSTGVLLWDSAGLVSLDHHGNILGQGRFGNTVILSADRAALVAFPMHLQLPSLEPLSGLSRPTHLELTHHSLTAELLIGWGNSLALWRLADGGKPTNLEVPANPSAVSLVGEHLFVDTAEASLVFALSHWPPQRLDAFESARARGCRTLSVPPSRFVVEASGAVDRVRGSLAQKAEFCHEVARYGASRSREGAPELREVAIGLLRDALVVEAEAVARAAGRLAAELADNPRSLNVEAWSALLDRALQPLFLLEGQPESFDEASSRRLRGLLATCAGAALSAVGERISARATRGETADGEIEAAIAGLAQIRGMVLSRAPGLGWTGLDGLMARWKQLGKEARELADVAAATRALGRLAAASTLLRGADARVDEATVTRLGRSIGDLAARSAADAEVDALLLREDLSENIAQGLQRARRDLGNR